MAFTADDYRQLLCRLAEQGDDEYRRFTEGLTPGITGSYGVRVPVLRAMARDILRAGDGSAFLEQAGTGTREERLLMGLVIAGLPGSMTDRLERTRTFLPLINSWEICDVFCAAFKSAARFPEEVRLFLQPLFSPGCPVFTRRFAVVMRMDYFINDAYIDETLALLDGMDCRDYYVQMAVAWALSVCLIKYRDRTMPLFTGSRPDAPTCLKAIQKALDSYRVSPQDKEELRRIRAKIRAR